MSEVTKPVMTDETGKRIAAALETSASQEILSELDGTADTYKTTMRKWFVANGAGSASKEELTALCDKWYELTRDAWCGWVDFYQTDVSSVSTGTRGGDNTDMTCTPSTDTVAGQDDYAGLPLFACVDVNFIVDETTRQPVITAIDGITNNFKRYSPDYFVGVMQMSGYIFWKEATSTYTVGYSAVSSVPASEVEPLPDAVNPDGSFREWVVHAKYPSRTVDGHMTSYAGVIPTAFLSCNTSQTAAKACGAQYSGLTTADITFRHIMYMIKYASLTMDGIIQGTCSAANLQYPALVSESGVNRIIVTTTQGANFEVGMSALLGPYDSSQSTVLDRGNSNLYSITGNTGALVTSIENVTIDDEEYAAIYLDCDPFDTTANGSSTDGTTYISSFHWKTGTTDAVLGNDGSITSCTSGKYPGKLQGIEYMLGAYENVTDVILQMAYDDDGICYYEPWIVRNTDDQTTSLTSNYVATGLKCPDTLTSSGWNYIKKKGYKNGVIFPIEVGGSSSTYYRDGFNQAAATTNTRGWRDGGSLTNSSAGAGFASLNGASSLSATYWHFASRLSASGNRGEWGA